MLDYSMFLLEKKEEHDLAGVVLIYNKKILLVKPKKFKKKLKKWSIPKGHTDDREHIITAFKELKEESAIKIDKNKLKNAKTVEIEYIKNKAVKKLKCYIVKIGKKDLNIKLFNNMILGNFLKKETIEAGFFNRKDAEKLIEPSQKKLLEYID